MAKAKTATATTTTTNNVTVVLAFNPSTISDWRVTNVIEMNSKFHSMPHQRCVTVEEQLETARKLVNGWVTNSDMMLSDFKIAQVGRQPSGDIEVNIMGDGDEVVITHVYQSWPKDGWAYLILDTLGDPFIDKMHYALPERVLG